MKGLRFIVYIILFAVSFLVFLYWMFPYDILKDRVAGAIEAPFERAIEVEVGKVRPYYFTGVAMSDLRIAVRDEINLKTVIKFDKVRMRASLFSLLFGRPKVAFFMRAKKGDVEGSVGSTDDGYNIYADFDEFDVSAFEWLESQMGMKLKGKLSGTASFKIDKARQVKTAGRVNLAFDDFGLSASEFKSGEVGFPIPETVISKGRASKLKMTVEKGVANLDEFKLSGGDIEVAFKGKVFLSADISNYRINLTGSFKVSDKLSEAFPLLFMMEKQRQQDGTYPVSVTGRLAKPQIKIGTFTLPI